ncbi:MAG TPA: GNAT family N-acetyltransferase [Dehalococcoidia bacterium]|nr:GNAT family N-acetyltransferase [Dehalococcoidia bacterium]
MTEAACLTIRAMTDEDVGPLAHSLGTNEASIDHRWRHQTFGWQRMLVACVGGLPVGSVNIDEREDLREYLHLFALGVAPEFRRQGIGSRLIGRVEEAATKRGCKGVFLNVGIENPDARRLYERLGYVAEGDEFEITWHWLKDDGTEGGRESEVVVRMFKRFPGP